MLMRFGLERGMDMTAYPGSLVVEIDTYGHDECGVWAFFPKHPLGKRGEGQRKRLEGRLPDGSFEHDTLRVYVLDPEPHAGPNRAADHEFLVSYWRTDTAFPRLQHVEMNLREHGPVPREGDDHAWISSVPRRWILHVKGLGFSITMPADFNVTKEVMEG